MSFSKTQFAMLGLIGGLGLVTVLIWMPLVSTHTSKNLEVHFLDVGQGDAVFIRTPSNRSILIDGGPDASVLRELGRVMPFWERSIDMVVATHPDTDHVGGLFEVVKRFRVSTLLRPGVAHDAPAATSLFSILSNEHVEETLARRGQVYDFGDGVVLEVLFPDREVSGLEPNDASIILQIRYGAHSFLFTGDTSKSIEEYVVSLDEAALASSVLKIGHHGSDTSSSELFVGFVNPQYAIFSRGCDNRYGHPHEDVVAVFTQFNIPTLDTCLDGRVSFFSDGTILRTQ